MAPTFEKVSAAVTGWHPGCRQVPGVQAGTGVTGRCWSYRLVLGPQASAGVTLMLWGHRRVPGSHMGVSNSAKASGRVGWLLGMWQEEGWACELLLKPSLALLSGVNQNSGVGDRSVLRWPRQPGRSRDQEHCLCVVEVHDQAHGPVTS